jgi:hypothetical protein
MLRSLGRFTAGVVLLTLGAGVGIGVISGGTAGAVTVFTVTTTSDPALASTACPATTDPCSLRAAVAAANATAGGATVDLPASATPYTLTIGPSGSNDNTTGDLNVTGNVTIDGQGALATDTVIDGNATDRVLDVASGGTADLSELTIQNGHTSSADNSGPAQQSGGGVATEGTLTLNRVAVSDNTGDGGGGIDVFNGTSTTLTDVTVNGNTAGSDGGGLEIEENTLPGTVTVTGAEIDHNSSGTGGGGIATDGSDTLSVSTSDISDNFATGGTHYGGGVFIDGVGSTDTFTTDTIETNEGFAGGGVVVDEGATTITGTTISGNVGDMTVGGVLDQDTNAGETLTINSSTIANNSTPESAAPVAGAGNINGIAGDGGGMLVFGCANTSLTNDTVVLNSDADGTTVFDSPGEGSGSGYLTDNCFPAGPSTTPSPTTNTILNDTFANNTTAAGGSGDFGQGDDEQIDMANTIIANGTTISCGGFLDGAHESSGGYNMYSDNEDNCFTADTTSIGGTDPKLGALANNGGPTETEAPLVGSPAIAAIPASHCALTTDQRGESRPQGAGSTCTIGAVEEATGATGPPAGGGSGSSGGGGGTGSGGGGGGGGGSTGTGGTSAGGFNPNGYRMDGADGGAFDFGTVFAGSLAGSHIDAPIVGLADEPDAQGYLMVGSDGGVFSFAGAGFYGSLGGQSLASPIAAIATTPDGKGYWLVSKNGRTYNFGDAPALPSLGALNKPIVGAATTQTGKGLWLVGADGGVFSLGDAVFEGSLGTTHLNAPIVAIASSPTGEGYVLAAADGGVFAFNVAFKGSAANLHLNAPITGIALTNSGQGYWLSAADGGVFAFGDAPFLGSMVGTRLNGPIVGIQHLGQSVGS